MDIKDQVCSLQQAKKLKELGVDQNSYFLWIEGKYGSSVTMTEHHRRIAQFDPIKEYAAFTTAELVQMIGCLGNIEFSKRSNKFYSQTNFNDDATQMDKFTFYRTFTEACADKLIRGIEKEHITIKECNKRLNA